MLYFSLLVPFMRSACQKPFTSYLQLLPLDLVHIQMNRIFTNQPLWQDDQENTRIEQSIAYSTIFQEIGGINLNSLIINRMRNDLVQVKKKLLEPFETKDMNWFMAFLEGKMPADPTPKKSAFSEENPKLFQKLLPLKSILDYCQIDQDWLKEFIMSKKCGGALRKHIFINAMKYRHEYLVNLLWNGKYRPKVMRETMRNRSFLRMTQNAAKNSGYHGIEHDLKKLNDKLTERIKAAQVWYPG